MVTGQKARYRQNWAGATNEELAADLERWAEVREGINVRKSDHLSTSNLAEAARRLRFCEDTHPSQPQPRSTRKVLCQTCGTRQVYDGSNYCRECGNFPERGDS